MSPTWTPYALLVGLKAFWVIESYLSPPKSTNSPYGWGHFETNPKILESLEGLEGYLCSGIPIFR